MEKKSNNNSVRHVGSNVKRKNTTNKNVKGKKKHPRLKKVIIIFALLIVLLVLVAVEYSVEYFSVTNLLYQKMIYYYQMQIQLSMTKMEM